MSTNTLKNDLLLKALTGQPVSRPPVWMMRQAGRYLPEYMKLKAKYDFFTRIETPELACEITLQPVDLIGTDAAIIFSDILVIPQALGLKVLMEEGRGPLLPQTIRTENDIDRLQVEDAAQRLDYVYKALALCKKELNGRVPLIGFAGAPFTILCYMVEGKGSKTFDKAKQFCFTQPFLAHQLLAKITEATIAYLQNQVAAGADCVQVFDSWSGILSPNDFNDFALPYLKQIADALSPLCPVILFPKGSWYALKQLSETTASGVGIDWTTNAVFARQQTNNKITLQGNFDPVKLLMPPATIKKEVWQMIDDFGTQRYIANLGHGILPNVPLDHAKAFIDAVKEYPGEMKEEFSQWIKELQNQICAEAERVDGQQKFIEDRWTREDGGGGITRVIENGAVFEKGGVNTSEVCGVVTPAIREQLKTEGERFFACGISLVIHPLSPMVPTVHANFRYFELYDKNNTVIDCWFGGGADLTPYYLVEDDARHFHQAFKDSCDKFHPSFYANFKKQCDDYFVNHHRNGERRGIGGIFYDYQRPNENISAQQLFDFAKSNGEAFMKAYFPIVEKSKNLTYNDEQKRWQLIRRGRYVEFNLIHDRGTIFGLKSKGRTESILMSLPLNVRFEYNYQPLPGSEEEKLQRVLLKPVDWLENKLVK